MTAILSLKTIDEGNTPKNGRPKTLLVSSAAGATGSIVVQLAKHQGYRVVGVVGTQDKVTFVKSLGASECICYNDAKNSKTGQIDSK